MKPLQKDKAIELPGTLWKFVWKYLRTRKIYMLSMFFVDIAWCIQMVMIPYLLKEIIDVAISNGSIGWYCALFVGFTALGVFVTNFHIFISSKLYPKISAEIISDMHQYLINHSYSYFQNNFSGGLTKKMFDMSSNFEKLITIPNAEFFTGTLRLIVSSAILFYVVQPVFSLILIVWSILFVYLTYFLSRNTQQYSKQLSEADVGVGSVLSDSITNIMSVKLYSGADRELKKVNEKLDRYTTCDQQLRRNTAKINSLQGVAVVLLMGLMLASLMYFRTQNKISIGDFALVIMLVSTFIQGIYMIGRQIVEFHKIVGICTQSLSIIREPHEVVDAVNAKDLRISKATIEFNKVYFSYSHNLPVFKNLNLIIESGQKVGLVGLSGGGKSTLVKILLRLYDLQNGSILIDGQDIKYITKISLLNQIATIPQEPELFHRTVLENIQFAKPDADKEEVLTAAKIANCHSFIIELPQGYNTLVGERGVKLSGGQRQRIAIARAVLKNSPILILDEATSALDSLTEQYIQEGLHEAMKGKTVIVIAHRLSTLKNMDRVLVFENGVIVEDGSPSHLLNNVDGKFSRLWKMQSEGFIKTFD